ncbi:hypothetical protein ACQ4M3_35135 [Leptolyngbya sp. AN03gr2]|uniref:hypothetical protein n=1 Tax=unclassified Leptolyngbya TaxID=2650499 RepID=UPI003D30F409
MAIAASTFIHYESFHTTQTQGHSWVGQIRLTPSPFRVIARPNLFRRQLHFENFTKGGIRKRKGGTVTPFGFRTGDFVQGKKAGVMVRGWVGGYSNTEKTKNVSLYDHNWHRIRQFSPSKVSLIKRSTRLCVD